MIGILFIYILGISTYLLFKPDNISNIIYFTKSIDVDTDGMIEIEIDHIGGYDYAKNLLKSTSNDIKISWIEEFDTHSAKVSIIRIDGVVTKINRKLK